MKKFWQKLKIRWGIESDWQVAIILIVFSLTGFTFLFISPYLDSLFGLTENDPLWLKVIFFVVITLPVYNLLLIIWGTILGQYRFFKNFIINFFGRIFGFNKKK